MTSRVIRSLQLVPDDVVFFRDGKPSSIGQDHYLRSLFPPFPSTLYGALRTLRLIEEGVDLPTLTENTWNQLSSNLRRELGEWRGFGSMSVRGPWITRQEAGRAEVLLPAPQDLGLLLTPPEPRGRTGTPIPKRDASWIKAVVRYRPDRGLDDKGAGWSHPLELPHPYEWKDGRYTPWAGSEDPSSPVGWYLDPAGMKTWLDGGIPDPARFVSQSDLWEGEARTGVGLQDDKRVHKEHMLYTFGFVRLTRGIGFGFEVELEDPSGKEFGAGGHVRLGGDGRTARLQDGPGFPSFDVPVGSGFVLYLATPCLAESGAYPPGFDQERRDGTLGGVPCRLTSAVMRGGALIGGWDIARGQPRTLRRAIPAGAVYRFSAVNAGLSALQGRCLSGYPDEHLSQQGFGLALIGRAV